MAVQPLDGYGRNIQEDYGLYLCSYYINGATTGILFSVCALRRREQTREHKELKECFKILVERD